MSVKLTNLTKPSTITVAASPLVITSTHKGEIPRGLTNFQARKVALAQQTLCYRAKCNRAARKGNYPAAMEGE